MRVHIVCPEESVYDEEAAFVTLPTTTGSVGVAPLHASEISTLTTGYVRVCADHMGEVTRTFAVNGGYVEIKSDEVIVLAERAADLAAADAEDLKQRIAGFEEQLSKLAPKDARRSYLYNEIAWCKLLLS